MPQPSYDSKSSEMGAGAVRPGWGRRVLVSTLAVLLLSLVGLALGEVLIRVLRPAGNRYYIWLPGLSVTFTPSPAIVHGVAPAAHFKVNSRGALGEELPTHKTNEYRILTIGGSTTQSIMLDQSKTWPTLLERALARTADGRRVRIANLGRAGFNSRDHLGAMRYVVDQYDADAIIMLLGGNDMIERLVQGDAYDPYFVQDERRYRDWLMSRFAAAPLAARSSSWHQRTAIWQLAKSFKAAFFETKQLRMDNQGQWLADARQYRQRAPRQDTLPPLQASLDEFERNVRAIVAEAKKRSLRIVFVTQPTFWKDVMTPAEDKLLWMGFGPGQAGVTLEWPWWQSTGQAYLYTSRALKSAMDSYNQRLLDTCAQLKVECFDMASRLPRTTEIYFDDMHYTELGARRFADALAAYLKTTAPFAGRGASTTSRFSRGVPIVAPEPPSRRPFSDFGSGDRSRRARTG